MKKKNALIGVGLALLIVAGILTSFFIVNSNSGNSQSNGMSQNSDTGLSVQDIFK